MRVFKNQFGQGLMETTIAIGVIITAIVGSISLVAFTIRSTNSTLNRLIAQNLAWEGIEVVVSIRDTNFLNSGTAFDDSLNGGGDTTAIITFDETSNVWLVDFTPNTMNDAATTLYETNGLYVQASSTPSGQATQFKRLIQIVPNGVGRFDVTSQVQWNERGSIFTVESYRSFFDWKTS